MSAVRQRGLKAKGRDRSDAVPFALFLFTFALVAPWAAPAVGQSGIVEPVPLARISAPIVQVVALEGERAPGGRFESVGTARINRLGDVGFFATVVQGSDRRRGLFAWLKGPIVTIAREGDETGLGPLLVLDAFGDWAWSEGPRAAFLGAADANANGVFDPGTDPKFLFLATRDRLTRLVGIGQPLDGGTLLSVRSFRLNEFGQVAFQARVDRNGDGQFTPGVDTAAIYLVIEGRIQALVREGERVGDGRVRDLDTVEALEWKFNNRAEAVLRAGLDREGDAAEEEAILLVNRFGDRLVVRSGLRTGFGTIRRLGPAALSNQSEVVFPATLSADADAEFGLFRYRSSTVVGPQELLVRPGDVDHARTIIRRILPTITVNDLGLVGFCGTYDQDQNAIDGVVTDPFACFILAPDFLYEVVRQGDLNRWGRVRDIQTLVLNNRIEAAVQVTVESVPLGERGPIERGRAILFWENGIQVGIVGPGDRIPGGRVGSDATLFGLSDNGWLAFGATVTDDRGVTRRGIFAAWLSE
jgi:hypothetical protein